MKKLLISILFLIAFTHINAQPSMSKVKGLLQKKAKPATDKTPEATPVDKPATDTVTTATVATTPAADMSIIKAFNNYDFIPGDTVVFEDHFTDDQQGEFPEHWNLGAGQGVMNKIGGQPALLLTQGNYAHVSPLIKAPVYFLSTFTIEFDWYFNGSYGPHIYLYENSSDAQKASNNIGDISLDHEEALAGIPSSGVELSGHFPEEITGENHYRSWHHVAIAFKKNQLKVYVDQYRVLVIPNLGVSPHAFDIEGIGDINIPITLSNFRVARGAGMNMLGKKFTEAKIVTHGINFDIDKATIRPESMGTLNMIAGILKENPDVKFEIDGHTDNTGGASHNLTLSQQRAAAVREQLIAMGIDATRLTTKGFGSTKPISDNTTLESKANNRRVEFVKM